MAEEFNTQGMLDVYLFENGQLLEQLQNLVLEQKDEECFDEDGINEIFRTMHTIKGSSAIMMFDDITKLSHKLEDVFYYLRESKPEGVPHLELVDLVLRVADFIMAELDKIRDGEAADGDSGELVANLDAFLERIKAEKENRKKILKKMCMRNRCSFIFLRWQPVQVTFTRYILPLHRMYRWQTYMPIRQYIL